MKAWLLWMHRWIALIFAVPLAVVIVTGLILSFEPMAVVNGIKPASLTTERMLALIDQHDPRGEATRISVQHYNGTLTLQGEDRVSIDLATGSRAEARSELSDLFRSSRRMHERLVGDLGWLVEASTIVMLVLAALGLWLGFPRLRNTLANWHKGLAWSLLPLIVISPLSGLGILYGISLASPPPAEARGPLPANLKESIRIIGARHDLSALVSLRKRGKRQIARIVENGEYRNYAVTRAGTVAMPRNWPRLVHEGNWWGNVSALVNIITSVALVGLLFTGVYAWLWRISSDAEATAAACGSEILRPLSMSRNDRPCDQGSTHP
ncbi:MAG: hypothetical protein RLZ98_92 [Pseudomonadota bacterium]|jgi:uncharacterized iron-regulated membrane protein